MKYFLDAECLACASYIILSCLQFNFLLLTVHRLTIGMLRVDLSGGKLTLGKCVCVCVATGGIGHLDLIPSGSGSNADIFRPTAQTRLTKAFIVHIE